MASPFTRWIAWASFWWPGSLKQKWFYYDHQTKRVKRQFAAISTHVPEMLMLWASSRMLFAKASKQRRHVIDTAWRRWFFRSKLLPSVYAIAVMRTSQCRRCPRAPQNRLRHLCSPRPPAILADAYAFFIGIFQYEARRGLAYFVGCLYEGKPSSAILLSRKQTVILRSILWLTRRPNNLIRISNGRGACGKCTKRFFFQKSNFPGRSIRNPVVHRF